MLLGLVTFFTWWDTLAPMKAVGARRRWEPTVIVVALCLAAAGSSCGGDGGQALPAETVDPAAKARADSIVVKLSDLPAGYRVYTSSNSGGEAESGGPDLSTECTDTDPTKDAVIGDADDVEYETELAYLTSDAAIFASADEAEGAFEQLRQVIDDPSFEDCLLELMGKSIEEGAEVKGVTVEDLDVTLPAGADELVSWRMQVPVEATDPSSATVEFMTYMDFVFLRGGDATSILMTLGLTEPFDEALRDSLLERVAGRM
jgi:hypothetical protein